MPEDPGTISIFVKYCRLTNCTVGSCQSLTAVGVWWWAGQPHFVHPKDCEPSPPTTPTVDRQKCRWQTSAPPPVVKASPVCGVANAGHDETARPDKASRGHGWQPSPGWGSRRGLRRGRWAPPQGWRGPEGVAQGGGPGESTIRMCGERPGSFSLCVFHSTMQRKERSHLICVCKMQSANRRRKFAFFSLALERTALEKDEVCSCTWLALAPDPVLMHARRALYQKKVSSKSKTSQKCNEFAPALVDPHHGQTCSRPDNRSPLKLAVKSCRRVTFWE